MKCTIPDSASREGATESKELNLTTEFIEVLATGVRQHHR